MKKNLNTIETKIVKLNVELFFWKEDAIYYAYAPALDLTGYGLSKGAAKDSFETILSEFVVYIQNKRTIFIELEKLGWAVNKRKKKIVSPDIDEMLSDNEHFNQLFNSKELTKSASSVNLEIS